MINPVLSIALLAASSFASPQHPALKAVLPNSPVLLQLTDTTTINAQVKAADPKAHAATPETAADDLFAGSEKFAQGASESTEINLDPDSMQMVGSKGKNGSMAKKMKTMMIRSYKYDKPDMYKMEDIEVYRKKLEDGSWKCSVRVREKKESTDICSRLGADHETREMVILTAEPKEITIIHMTGQMSLDELGHAANGLQHRGDGDK